ncbi:MAG: hypothetical protein ABF289_11200 [Clostridiales bacterium]
MNKKFISLLSICAIGTCVFSSPVLANTIEKKTRIEKVRSTYTPSGYLVTRTKIADGAIIGSEKFITDESTISIRGKIRSKKH